MGSFVVNMVDALSAFSILIVLLTSPWMVVLMIGYVVRRGYYLVDDLQVFNRGEKGGATGSPAGELAGCGGVAGCGGRRAAVREHVDYCRGRANAAGGIDISLPVTLLARGGLPGHAAAVPGAARRVRPGGPRFVPARDTVRIEEIRQRRSVEPTTSV